MYNTQLDVKFSLTKIINKLIERKQTHMRNTCTFNMHSLVNLSSTLSCKLENQHVGMYISSSKRSSY